MNDLLFDPGAALAIVAAIIAIGAAIVVARARSVLAISLMLAALAAALAAAFLALDAPDLALTEALIGAAIIPLLIIGAMLLTAPSARKRVGKIRVGAIAASVAVGAALIWAASDLPLFGEGAGDGRIFVNRAAGETGVRDAVAAVTGNYRAIDSLAQLAALMAAALGAYALLGFGERAGGRKRTDDEGAP